VKFLLYSFALPVGMGCLVLACNQLTSGEEANEKRGNEKHIVRNQKPTPKFSIPDRIPGRDYVYFMAIGDQGMGDSSQKHVAFLMNEKARKDSLNFVITLGDNFYNKGVTSTSDPQWLEKFEAMYALPHLDVHFYPSLGNHDHYKGNSRYQVEYHKTNDKWRMQDRYYTFSKKIGAHSSIQFFALDTYSIVIKKNGRYDADQIQWLERELAASTATWKIVYGHHPVFSYGKHGNEKRMINRVRPLLEKYQVALYISGHDHDRQFLEPVGGVHYIVSGTGSKSRHTRYGETTIFAATNLGFVWFRVSADEFHVQSIDGNGDIEFAHTWEKGVVTKRHYEAFARVGRFSNFLADIF